MNSFDLAQSFIERCLRGDPREDIERAFGAAMGQLGFRFYACCADVNPAAPPTGAIVTHNYPTSWERYFLEAELYRIDPVLQRARRSPMPFAWNSAEFRTGITAPGSHVLAAASTYGLKGGYTEPIHLSWWPRALRASCSLVPDSASVSFRQYEIAGQLATVLYASALHHQMSKAGKLNTPVILPARARQCLELCVHGLTDWEISQILNVGESTVRTHVMRAMQRIDVKTRSHVVAYALLTGQIAYGDVTRVKAKPELPRSVRDFSLMAVRPTIGGPDNRNLDMRTRAEELRISREAASWHERREEGMSKTQRVRYARWLKRSPAHVGAMLFYEEYCDWLQAQGRTLARH